MKQQCLSIALWLITLVGFSQVDKPVDSRITQVTVFLSKAQVTREVRSHLDVGRTNLIITGLTSRLDPASIQVTGKGSFIILGISHQQNYLNEFNMPKDLKWQKDSVEYLQKQAVLEQSQKDILTKEEQLLMSNQKIGGANQNLTVAELKEMADFFVSRLKEIVSARVKADEKIKTINEHVAKLQKQINVQNELYSRNTSEIVVRVSAEVPTAVEMEVNYVVANASWNPEYDLRAMNTKSPIQLSYKANVRQSTGEDWKNVKLKLSTANPNQSGLKPELFAWYLNFNAPVNYAFHMKESRGMAMKTAAPAAVDSEDDKELPEAGSTADYVSTLQTSLNTEFNISLPYSVPSSAKPTLVDIRNYEVNADYRYAVAPKLDPDAFLLARVTGWEEYNLLPGEANIFFEGTFVGNTFIDPNNTKDTLSVSLGRDKRIVVRREKLKELTSRRLIGANQKENYAWQISVRNAKTEAIKVIVEDQVPVSQNSQIEVSVTDITGANYNKDSGKLIWELTLQPSETKNIFFKYEVKYPKDKPVNGL